MTGKRKSKGSMGPNGLQDEINCQLRRDIRRGIYQPGSKLPSRAELEKRYQTTPVTIQKSFDKMKEDGFIRAEGPRGTFVADHPPCFSNIGIVFPHHFNSKRPEMNFFRVLAEEALKKNSENGLNFTIYAGLNGYESEADYIRLRDDIQFERLAGIIFASSPHLLYGTPLYQTIVDKKELAKVAFMSGDSHDFPIVTNSTNGYVSMIMDYLAGQGVKRLAILAAMSEERSNKVLGENAYLEAAAKRNIQILPHHIQVMYHGIAPRAKQLVQLLLHCRDQERPDALVITDDSLVEAACQGIADAGSVLPKSFITIGYCNFPAIPSTAVPLCLYGMNVNCFLDKCISLLMEQLQGNAIAPLTLLPYQFSDQFNTEKGEANV